VPVVSSNAGGIPEVNINGVTGYLSDVGDVEDMAKNAISILKDEATHKQFCANALKQAQQFSLDNIMPQYEAYYEHIVKTSVFSEEA